MSVRLIVGLGNPGSRYESTRHNAGFWFVEELARVYGGSFRAAPKYFGDVCELNVNGELVRLLKPTTFMNNSGRAVAALTNFYRFSLSTVVVAHDEIDLPPGTVRLKQDGGHGGHNGLRDIIPQLGGTGFARIRIGVGHPGQADQVISYVLQRAPGEQQRAIDDAIARTVELRDLLLAGEWQKAMNELHRKAGADDVVGSQ